MDFWKRLTFIEGIYPVRSSVYGFCSEMFSLPLVALDGLRYFIVAHP